MQFGHSETGYNAGSRPDGGDTMLRETALIAMIIAAGCGAPEQSEAPEPERAAAPAENIRDETHRFHKEGLVAAKVVQDNLAGKEFMPGGNIAEYEKDGKKYQVFFALRRNAEVAMFLSMDYKDVLTDAKFIPHFGGYFGMDGDTPTFIFQKEKYLIGITGLDQEDADHAGRLIAGYLN